VINVPTSEGYRASRFTPMKSSVSMFAEFVLQLALTAWVYQDARKRDWKGDRFADTPFKWALGAFFLWIVAVPVYLHKRGKRPLVDKGQTAA
jgi:hypothetical protein